MKKCHSTICSKNNVAFIQTQAYGKVARIGSYGLYLAHATEKASTIEKLECQA